MRRIERAFKASYVYGGVINGRGSMYHRSLLSASAAQNSLPMESAYSDTQCELATGVKRYSREDFNFKQNIHTITSHHAPSAYVNHYERKYSSPPNPPEALGPTVPSIVPTSTVKKRIKRKGGTLQQEMEETESEARSRTYPVVAYATCDEINLEKLRRGLSVQGLYVVTAWPKDCDAALHDVIHVLAKYPTSDEPREIFFFREGTVVFWNVPELERNNVLLFLSEFQEESYGAAEVLQESEYMLYTHSSNEQQRQTKLVRGQIQLSPTSDNLTLEKYTVANSMALSVKLGILESTLDKFVEGIDQMTEELKAGTKLKATRAEVLRKTGELFSLRNELNLNSDLLDTPDFYWEHEDLENLYHKMCNYLSIGRRTGVMNEKLSQCCELLELITGYLNDKHHVRLEWMIIALITIEVVLGLSHFVK